MFWAISLSSLNVCASALLHGSSAPRPLSCSSSSLSVMEPTGPARPPKRVEAGEDGFANDVVQSLSEVVKRSLSVIEPTSRNVISSISVSRSAVYVHDARVPLRARSTLDPRSVDFAKQKCKRKEENLIISLVPF